jgi:chemotaxis protein CheX
MDFTGADLQVFVDAVVHYFAQTTGDDAMVSPPFAKGEADEVLLDYTGVIGVSGKARGSIYFTAETALLRQLLQASGFAEHESDESLLMDMVGEVANTMSGNARQHFGTNFLVSVPVMLSRRQVFSLPRYLRTFVIPITWHGCRCSLVVCLGSGTAVYGALKDIPAEEVLGMAARGSSILRLRELPGGLSMELTVHRGQLRALKVNNEPVAGVLETRARVARLLKDSEGFFELLREPTPDAGPLDLPLKQLILSSMAEVPLEATLTPDSPNLPLAETVFVMTDRQDYWLDPDTQIFLELASGALRIGASANMIASSTGMPPTEITRRLYVLQTAGLVAPMRAYARAARIPLQAVSRPTVTAPPPSARIPMPEAPPLETRLPLPASAPVPSQEGGRSGLVSRLLSGLKQRLPSQPTTP